MKHIKTAAIIGVTGITLIAGFHSIKTTGTQHNEKKVIKENNILLSNIQIPNTQTFNQQILNKIQYKKNRATYWDEAVNYHGSIMDNCVYWMSSLLRNLGEKIPTSMGSTGNFSEWLLHHGWTNHQGINGVQPGDICFAGFTHTFIFVSWYNKEKGLANVTDNQIAYFNPNNATYVRHLYGANTPVNMPGGASTYDRTTNYLTPPQINKNFVQVNRSNGITLCNTINGGFTLTIPNNTRLKVISKRDGWYYVNYNGNYGWVAGWVVNRL